MSEFAGPSWDLSSEYTDTEDPRYRQDWDEARHEIAKMRESAALLEKLLPRVETIEPTEFGRVLPDLIELARAREAAILRIWNLRTFITALLSVDTAHAPARKERSLLQTLQSEFEEALKVPNLLLARIPDDCVEVYLAEPAVQAEHFYVHDLRKLRSQMLSLEEEQLVAKLSVPGLHSWTALYESVSGDLKCRVRHSGGGVEEISVVSASGRLAQGSDTERRATWEATQAAWRSIEESCAASLNAIASWRLELCTRRSKLGQSVSFLDSPLHAARIRRETLDSMMKAVRGAHNIKEKALRYQAGLLGKEALDPWDLSLASIPGGDSSKPVPFEEAFQRVRAAFASEDREMGEFADLMRQNRWIEGTVSERKRVGGYSTRFPKSKTPRIYLTYQGNAGNIRTLAHELGHAFHFWVMRDLPSIQCSYPMTLAETASIYAEASLMEHQMRANLDRSELAWAQSRSIVTFLINIPMRFDLEHEFYRRRAEGQGALSAAELTELTTEQYRAHYGSFLNGADSMFWASKHHFFLSTPAFYNFPYTFGFLFSQGVRAMLRREPGSAFRRYRELLRDTGRMEVEELALKHLAVDLGESEFWVESIREVERQFLETAGEA